MFSLADFAYAIILLGALFCAAFVTLFFRVRIERSALLFALAVVSIPFVIWDSLVVRLGHWGFNEEYTLELFLGNLAIEEILFFVVIPILLIAVYGAIFQILPPKRFLLGQEITMAILILSLGLALFNLDNGYTLLASLAVALTAGLLLFERSLIQDQRFWVYQAALFALFIASNSVLTSLPIIEYGEAHFLGLRIGTIPVEDFLYNFALFNLLVLAYRYWLTRSTS